MPTHGDLTHERHFELPLHCSLAIIAPVAYLAVIAGSAEKIYEIFKIGHSPSSKSEQRHPKREKDNSTKYDLTYPLEL